MSRPKQKMVRHLDAGIAVGLSAGYVAVLWLTADTLGYARDEGFYFQAASAYARWFELLWQHPSQALVPAVIDQHWSVNHEHPALIKSLFAFSHMFFYQRWHWIGEAGTAFRLPGMVLSGLAVSVVFLWGRRVVGRGAGMVGALSFGLMPRVFYHSHLDCFDMPVAAMWLVTTYAYWRSLSARGLGWPLATGILYGLLLDTKHNSWLLPGALIVHLLLTRGPELAQELRRGRLAIPAALVSMAVLGPIVFYLGWPWIWHDTGRRLADYVAFHLGHEYYNMEFLGQTYWKPPMPRLYAWVMTMATVPAITLLLAGIGLWTAVGRTLARRTVASPSIANRSIANRSIANRSIESGGPRPDTEHDLARERETTWLWLVCLCLSYAPWLSTKTPIFGGTKHWITAYPYLGLFAAVGFEKAVEQIRALWPARWRASSGWVDRALGASVLLGPLIMTVDSHPWGLSAYTPLVGGASGAATLGLNRTFWGYTTGAVAGFLNQNVPSGGVVYVHDTALQSFAMLTEDGRIRPDIRPTLDIHASDFALYHHEPHMSRVEHQIWVDYGTTAPAHVGVFHGVPVVWVYARPHPGSR